MYTVLALDLATHTGYALLQGRVVVESGTVNLSCPKGIVNPDGYRLMKFHNWLLERAEEGLSEIVYEKVNKLAGGHHGAKKKGGMVVSEAGAKTHYALLGMVEMICHMKNIPLFAIHNMTLKSKFGGNGKATKEDMCAMAHRLGWEGGIKGTDASHDEADAIGLLYVLMQERGEQIYL